MMTSADLYPLARRLHALIPGPLRCWTGEPGDPDARDRLTDDFLVACAESVDVDEETNVHNIVISEALAGFLTMWGCRYRTLDDEVNRAQAALVTALGGVVHEPGVYQLQVDTPIPVAAIAHLIGWVTVLDVLEAEG